MAGRIGVLGAGGMGSAFAAFLARSGHDVVLVGRGGEHVAAVARDGLLVQPPAGEPWRVAVPVAARAADLEPASLAALIVLTKAFDAAGAVEAAAPALAPDGVAVSLQNGLGLDAALAGAVGAERALVGTTTVGATRQEPGRVTITPVTAQGRAQNHVGQLGVAAGGARGAGVVAALTAAGLPATAHEHVGAQVWAKLALAVMSPVSAVLRATVGAVWASAEGRALVEEMFDETLVVAAAEGVALDRERAWAHAGAVFDGTGEHLTSMCSDVLAGRRTELASMAGAVHGLARRHGVPAPVHRVVLGLLGAAGVR